MKYTTDQLLAIASKYEEMASDLVKTAKIEPKAEVRNVKKSVKG